jgi:Heterokaryon incompatibility protein (HET)
LILFWPTLLLRIGIICIIQESVDDWQQQSPMMAEIFKNAYLTIGAIKIGEISEGLQGKADSLFVCTSVFSEDIYVLSGNAHTWQNDIDNAPLNHRGSVFQEKPLTDQLLNFSIRDVIRLIL